jgi:hypothetical protein
MKGIKKMVAASTLAMTLLGFGFNPEPVEARGLVCLLFGCKKVQDKYSRETDQLYGDPPDYDSIYGKLPSYNPDAYPYHMYGNRLERIMGRDVREIIELDKRKNKRPPGSWYADSKTDFRAQIALPVGELKKSFPLEGGNTAYMFKGEMSSGGSAGIPDRQESQTIAVPFDKYSYGVQTVYKTIPGTPGTPGISTECTTYLVADQYGKLFYWSYEGNSDETTSCSSDKRRLN